jgi:hypothetical protein
MSRLLFSDLPPVGADDDLEDVLSALDEVSVSRTTERRNRGVGSALDQSPTRNSPGARSSDSWSGPGQGTSGYAGESVFGKPEMMMSDGSVSSRVPVSVSTRLSRGSTGKKCKLIRIPQLDEGYSDLCLGLIGHGTTFCTALRCKTAHQGTVLSVPTPGELYVAKSPTTAFVDPKCHYLNLTPELWSDWNNRAASLDEWRRLFMLVNDDTEDGPANAAEVEARENFAVRAEAHRTPGKRKFAALETPWDMESTYKRQIKPTADEDNSFTLGSVEAYGILQNMDEGLEKTSLQMLKMSEGQIEAAKEQNIASRSMEHKLSKVEKEVGNKPQALAADINAPTVWGSIGALGAKLDGVESLQNLAWSDHTPVVAKEVARLVDPFKEQVVESLTERAIAVDDRITKLKSFIVRSTKRLSEKIEMELLDIGWNAKSPSQSEAKKPEWFDDVMKGFEGRLDKVSDRVSKVTAETDEHAIRFAGLGFRSSKESNAWLVLHMPDHHCGLVVDVHMVMEHIQAAITGTDSISMSDKLFKLKIKTLADGLAMKSFESKVPRYFSQSSVHKVVKHDASHFETIATFDEWDTPISGFRTRLKEELQTFRAAHRDNIDESLNRESIGYAVATMALTESVSWLEGFIVFLDDYYRDLTKAKFGSKKAWHVTTRLGRRMLLEIAVPRNGVQNAFHVGQNDQICQRILWSVLKAHDVMARYKRHNYKDDPTVSSELVKFLAVNTGYEVLDVLTTKMSAMEADVASLKKDVAAANKASASASNKADEGKKALDLLVKRVTKLEK